MSELRLTERQFAIPDSMVDDAESIEQVYLWINADEVRARLRETSFNIPFGQFINNDVKRLARGLIEAKYSSNEEVAPIEKLTFEALHHYWFAPTDMGKQAWEQHGQGTAN